MKCQSPDRIDDDEDFQTLLGCQFIVRSYLVIFRIRNMHNASNQNIS